MVSVQVGVSTHTRPSGTADATIAIVRLIGIFAVLAWLGCSQSSGSVDALIAMIDAPSGMLSDAGFGILPDGAECGREGEPCCYNSYPTDRCGAGLYCNGVGVCTSVGSCASCGAGQVCVQKWFGNCCCGLVECVTSTCTTCSDACLQELCGGPPFVCGGFSPPCGGELPDSFKCYGP